MKIKDAIRIVWEIESDYNQGKRFIFFQDLRKAIEQDLKNDMYYRRRENLQALLKEIA